MKRNKIPMICGLLGILLFSGCNEGTEPVDATSLSLPTVTQSAEAVVTKQPETTKAPDMTELKEGELQYSFREELNEAGDEEVTYFSSAIFYPVFFDGNGVEAVNRFVESLLAEFHSYLPEAEENAKYDYEDSQNGEFPAFIFPEVQEYNVSVLWQDEQRIVLYVQNYSYVGGAHPNTFGQAYVVSKADGTLIESETILADYGLTVDTMADYAANRIREEAGDALYVTDSEDELTEWVTDFLEGKQWYLTESGLVIFANPYDIAPYAYGVIECEISYEELEQGLKKD